ncbi:MAG TPA: 2-oxoglutarate dehydrogenase E1 component [Chitinivibrionales bacterium]|jgi:2-oxoglutarate dehydrogenase E1 component|nr:2-oxoglutarate dehydrogenase E1 component [Chitinivibrionales bacterium]
MIDGRQETLDNIDYVEELYARWQKDPKGVDGSWRAYFEETTVGPKPVVEMPSGAAESGDKRQPFQLLEQSRVDRLLWAYRDVGYLYARLNPLGDYSPDHSYLPYEDHQEYERLTLEEFGIPAEDLDLVFFAGRSMQPSTAPLRTLIEAFRTTYCSSIGAEFLHIQNKNIRRWLINAMESTHNHPNITVEQRRTILDDLMRTEELEHFLDTFFLGQRRFSLEGSEALVPALHFLVDSAARQGIEDIVLGATHRGRLSILTTILNMSAEELFSRFDENFHPGMYGGAGDVKYHIGYDTVHVNDDGSSVRISLASNPSHLESVDPVVQGIARARQDKKGDTDRKRVIPVLIHGDAAISGQGVVAETFNLSRLSGYSSGGTIHIVINNQIGFTTPSRSARSTFFPTDVAKMLPIPIFHVNGDNPESIVYIVDLALRFRQTFGRDCIIDVFCYRRHGHNEGDEPAFTHPRMYQLIGAHASIATLYGDICDQQGIMSKQDQQQVRQEHHARLKASLDKARLENGNGTPRGPAAGNPVPREESAVQTGVAEETLRAIAAGLTTVPAGFHINPKLLQIVSNKAQTLAEKNLVDWSLAESLAFGSLLIAGMPVRLSGQDSERGTFAQRHLTWWDIESPTPAPYTPLNALRKGQAPLRVFDSPLSEFSVLGFEYGYSLVDEATLTIWEAQFGDFANGAQVVIDNYLCCAERKWQQNSGLVLLLPHGSEGQGPDHSNGHLERFLQLCAQDNMKVCNATTPAQYFHLLRRQVLGGLRKPLVIMSPKSLLRHPLVVSSLSDLAKGNFEEVLDDPGKTETAARVLLCSGKIYYDLLAHRDNDAQSDTAILRLEQLYPFPSKKIKDVLDRYRTKKEIVWVQEEHKNYGAWRNVCDRFTEHFPDVKLLYRGRPESASAATGRLKNHREEQQRVVESAFLKE